MKHLSCYREPPRGWYCSRAAGHDGPCALVPAETSIGMILVAWVVTALAVVAFTLLFARAAECQGAGRLTPAQAADVLRDCTACLANADNWPAWPEGPTVASTGGRPGAAGWLEFPAPRPWLRLDGTPAWWPPVNYGSLGIGHGRNYGLFPSTILTRPISDSSIHHRR